MDTKLQEILEQHERLLQKTKSKRLLYKLVENGHGKFLYHWRKPNQSLSNKKEQIQDILKCDRQLRKIYKENMNGLSGYLDMCQELLKKYQEGMRVPFIGRSLFMPPITDFRNIDNIQSLQNKKFIKTEEAIRHIDKIGLVLVAGGLGERLSRLTSKISLKNHFLNHPDLVDDTFLGFYLKTIVSLQKLYTQKTGKITKVTIFIMCSKHNQKNVIEEVKTHYRAGIQPHQVTIEPQMEAPCLANLQGDLAISPKDNYRLIKKPLGHGYVHTLIQQKKYLDQSIIKEKEYLFFFQDTNPQTINTLLSSYGITRSLGYTMSWIGVKRHYGEQAGLIVGQKIMEKAKKKERKNRQVINIEYNRLQSGMKLPPGQFFANTNNFWIRIRDYREALKHNHEMTSFIINPKPIKTQTISQQIKYKPFRPETLMQDIARVLPPFSQDKPQAGVILYPRHLVFSPVKKPLPTKKTEKEKFSTTDIFYTSLDLELNNNRANLEKLQEKNTILFDKTVKIKGNEPTILTPLFQSPRIIFDPAFKLSRKYLRDHIQNCVFHPQSLLVIKGDNVYLHNVILEKHSALIIYLNPKQQICLTIKNFTVNNYGFSYIPIIDGKSRKGLNEEEKNRGYRISWKKPLVIKINKDGHYHYGINGLERE